MCDTLVIRRAGVTWFAKNSDREPDEPQTLVRIAPVRGDPAATVHTSYIDVPQCADRHAVLLSQPSWLWGGEMGINEHGLAIGNEAVFSKLVDRHGQSLLGMDLLRLALERAKTAREALDLIVWHLAQYGQGGPAGYRDKNFRYDNSFLLADPNEAWVLETAGRLWVAKRVDAWAISNCYSLGSDYDLASAGIEDEARLLGRWNGRGDFHFANAFDTSLYAFVGGAHRRRALNAQALTGGLVPGWAALARRLRDHGKHGDDFSAHDNRQVCLHAGSLLRPSQTTASLIARLAPGDVRYAATGTSAPCLSLFQPAAFDSQSTGGLVLSPGALVTHSRWASFEAVHQRALFDEGFRERLHAERDALEASLLAQADGSAPDWGAMATQAAAWHARWHSAAIQTEFHAPGRLGRWWRRCARRAAEATGAQFPD